MSCSNNVGLMQRIGCLDRRMNPDVETRLVDANVEVKLEISADVSSSVLHRPDGHREREDAQVRAARVRIRVIETVLKRR